MSGMNYNDSSVETGTRHYYSSSQGPFYNANNIFMFYGGGDRGIIVESIVRALRSDERIIHVHGERGSGKTMLSLVLSDKLKHRYNTIRYDVPDISGSLLLRHLLIELCPQKADLISAEQALEGVDRESLNITLNCVLEQLTEKSNHRTEKPYVLMIDSQTEFDDDVSRILDALTAVRISDQPIMHCLVFSRVAEETARTVNSISNTHQSGSHFWLRRLTLAEINDYLRHHMMLFDYNRRELFTREMVYFIADRSEGVFRAINTLARNAITIANLEDADKLSMSHLLMAGLPPRPEISPKSSFLSRYKGQLIAIMGSCVVASATALVFLLR